MSELWEICTKYWTLPVYVEWDTQERAAVATNAVGLLNLQKRILEETLKAFGWEANGRLWINKDKLQQIGRKCLHPDPEMSVRWTTHRVDIDSDERESEDEFEFIEQFSSQSFIRDINMARAYWHLILKHMLHWVLIQGRCLDLKFVKLFAAPYRPNWKNIIYRNLAGATPQDLCSKDELQTRFVEEATRPELLFHNPKTGKIYHSIEAVPQHWFWVNANKHEEERARTFKNEYWKSVLERMAELVEDSFQAYVSYLQQIRHPFPFCGCGGNEGDNSLPKKWGKLDGNIEEIFEADKIPDAIIRATGKEQDGCVEGVASKEEVVPEVPDI